MLQPKLFEVGETVRFSTMGDDGLKRHVGIVESEARTPDDPTWRRITDWQYDILVASSDGKVLSFACTPQCLMEKVGKRDPEPRRYERGQAVRFDCSGKALSGEIVVVDSRYREYSLYCSDWSYDILVEDYQGSPCNFKHVPQYKVLGVQR